MNDPQHPSHPLDATALHPLDELASAHLDGAADPIDVAAASGLSGFAERLAGFEQVRSQVRGIDAPVDEARRESALAAALAAFDELAAIDAPSAHAAATDAAGSPTTVIPIEVAAARRGRPGRRWQLVGVAAAVAAGALALVPMLTRDTDDGGDQFAADAPTAEDTDSLASEAARGFDEGTGGSAGDMATTMAAPKIGDFKDYDELAGAVRKELTPSPKADTPPAAPTTTTAAPTTTLPPNSGGDPEAMTAPAPAQTAPACAAGTGATGGAASSGETSTSIVYGGEATVDGQPYNVEVTEDGTGQRTLTVRDPASCAVADERPL
jgi:hypothetical protein